MTSLGKLTEISRITESKVDSFRDAGFEELEDLVDLTEADLEYIDGIGASKLNQIYQLLDREGIKRAEKDENYQKFRGLLEELFQFESADLDFGIYRIMNERRDRIETFLDEELEEKVQKELEEFKNVEQGDAKQDLEDAKEDIQENFPQWTDENGNVDEDEIPEDVQGIAKEHKEKYLNAKKELQKAEIGEETEAAIYQDLYRFFKRYYRDGDFIPQRRAANQEKYAIPYNGEEVKLHWANKDQYFVKTGEHFKDYKFDKDSYEIEFKLHDAHVEKNNKKGDDKFFVLREENPVEQDERFLTVHFEYRPLTEEDYEKYDLSETSQSSTYKKEIRKQTEEKILSEVSNELEETLDKEVENPRSESTVLQKHLKNYRTKNENDYFIHKDLGGFLEQELDFYLKNKVFSWKEMTDDNGEIPAHVRARLNAIENIAEEIIDFVAEIEDYQKKLFEKKKFVVNTEYCITLDKIPEELYPEILDNEEQIEEWKELYALEEQEDQGLEQFTGSEEIDEEFLKENQSMMVDTKHFEKTLKNDIISEVGLGDLEGENIHSENFQAMKTIFNKYKEGIDAVYIDPPYNTGGTEFKYKNNYRHSSWISMMENRLLLAKKLMSQDGIMAITIDEYEKAHLTKLCDRIFGEENRIGVITVVHNAGGRSDAKHIAKSHEYTILYAKNKQEAQTNNLRISQEELEDKYPNKDEESRYRLLTFRRSGSNSTKQDRPNMYYPIYYNPSEDQLSLDQKDGFDIELLPHDSKGVKRVWRWGPNSTRKALDTEFEVKERSGEYKIYLKDRANNTEKPKSFWRDSKYENAVYGTKYLKNMFKERDNFTYPKSVHNTKDVLEIITSEDSTVLDFFMGSGTTADAVIKLNQEDEGNRKYISIEMGDYFETILRPRIKKSVYSSEWDDGIPKNKQSYSHSFSYKQLEQYNETLDNLKSNKDQSVIDKFTNDVLTYFLNFEVDGESLLDLDSLKDPFNYEMKIREGDEAKRETIDLVETFNYLLGIEVENIERYEKLDREYRVVKGIKDEEEIVVVWRPVTDDPNDEFYEDEREFLKSEVLGDEDTVYINHDSALEAKPIEKKFQSEMWQD